MESTVGNSSRGVTTALTKSSWVDIAALHRTLCKHWSWTVPRHRVRILQERDWNDLYKRTQEWSMYQTIRDEAFDKYGC